MTFFPHLFIPRRVNFWRFQLWIFRPLNFLIGFPLNYHKNNNYPIQAIKATFCCIINYLRDLRSRSRWTFGGGGETFLERFNCSDRLRRGHIHNLILKWKTHFNVIFTQLILSLRFTFVAAMVWGDFIGATTAISVVFSVDLSGWIEAKT